MDVGRAGGSTAMEGSGRDVAGGSPAMDVGMQCGMSKKRGVEELGSEDREVEMNASNQVQKLGWMCCRER